jgi:hypothetical protein
MQQRGRNDGTGSKLDIRQRDNGGGRPVPNGETVRYARLQGASLALVISLPLVYLALHCMTDWRLTGEYVALYAAIVGLVVAAFHLTPEHK